MSTRTVRIVGYLVDKLHEGQEIDAAVLFGGRLPMPGRVTRVEITPAVGLSSRPGVGPSEARVTVEVYD